MKLIDKDVLVAEINKRIMDAPIDCYGHQRVWAYNDVKNILNTLEVKEVDLDKEIDGTYRNYVAFGRQEIATVAKHFFELGIKAQKGK